jgi:hypothetical protein
MRGKHIKELVKDLPDDAEIVIFSDHAGQFIRPDVQFRKRKLIRVDRPYGDRPHPFDPRDEYPVFCETEFELQKDDKVQGEQEFILLGITFADVGDEPPIPTAKQAEEIAKKLGISVDELKNKYGVDEWSPEPEEE